MLGAVLLQLPKQCHARAPSVWYHTLPVNCQNFMILRDEGKFLCREVVLTSGNIQKKRKTYFDLSKSGQSAHYQFSYRSHIISVLPFII
jgi:hypothetical protein